MTNMFFDWLNDAPADAVAAVKSGVDTVGELAQAALEGTCTGLFVVILLVMFAHAIPFLLVWLAGAPFWFIAAKAFGI